MRTHATRAKIGQAASLVARFMAELAISAGAMYAT